MFLSIGHLNGLVAIVVFYQHQQFTEDFTQVASVYLINNKEILMLSICCSSFAELIEYAVLQFKTCIFIRFITHYKILIAVVLVELHLHNSVIVLFAHQRICQSFSGKGLTNAWCSLQNQIFLPEQQVFKLVIVFIGDKNIIKELTLTIGFICLFLG